MSNKKKNTLGKSDNYEKNSKNEEDCSLETKNGFVNLVGIWESSAVTAYPKDNKIFDNGYSREDTKIIITKQKENLLWGITKWKLNGSEKYNTENFTGTFHTSDEFWLVESIPAPENGGPGLFQGKLISKNKILLTYLGVGLGFSSTAVYKRVKYDN